MTRPSDTQRDAVTAFLACPRCVRARLDSIKDGLRCRRCETEFPELDGIPWLFANPGVAWAEWRQRLDFGLKTLRHQAARAGAALEGGGLRDATAARIAALRAAYSDQIDALSGLMAPLELGALEANYTTYLALRTRLPSDQGLHTYYPNIHRDWCWGGEENRAAAAAVREALGDGHSGALLVLGSGASRLAYDLHHGGAYERCVAMDFNPMLMLVAKAMFAGEALELYEFPIAPRSTADSAVRQTLRAPTPARPGLSLVLGDALRAPFAAGCFDGVVTPWFVDVIPEEFSRLCGRVNHLLRPGGRWVTYGSLAFSNQDASINYSTEEVLAVIAESGFDDPVFREDTVPYMCSPHSRHGRRERVVAIAAVKIRDQKPPARYVALPDFLVKSDEPVPLLQSFQIQAMSTRIHAFMMTLVDGKRSIADMATLIEEHKLMPADQAEATVRNFLIKMYDESQRQTGI